MFFTIYCRGNTTQPLQEYSRFDFLGNAKTEQELEEILEKCAIRCGIHNMYVIYTALGMAEGALKLSTLEQYQNLLEGVIQG